MTSFSKKLRQVDDQLERVLTHESPVKAATVARYSTAAAQSIPDNTATIVDFGTVGFDTDSAVTVGAAWKFTCPTGKAGYYRVDVLIQFASSATWAAGEALGLYIFKGGAQYSAIYYDVSESATTRYRQALGSDVVNLADGEYIDIRVVQVSGGALALHNVGTRNHVAISRI